MSGNMSVFQLGAQQFQPHLPAMLAFPHAPKHKPSTSTKQRNCYICEWKFRSKKRLLRWRLDVYFKGVRQTTDKNLEQVLADSRDLRKDSKIHNVWVTKEAAHKFVDSLDEVITGEEYLAEQIFNVDDWNRIVLKLDASTHAHTQRSQKHAWI